MTALANPRADEEFYDFLIRSGCEPEGSEAARQWDFAGLGEGRRTMLRKPRRVAQEAGVAAAAANALGAGPEAAEGILEALGKGWSPAEAARAAFRTGYARTAAVVRARGEVRDFIARGYGVFGSVAWCGYDDRAETHGVYGQALVLSLGADGYRWEPSSTIDGGIAISPVLGWPRCSTAR